MERTPEEIFEENQKECLNELYKLKKQLRSCEIILKDLIDGNLRYPDAFEELPEVISDCISDWERAIENYEMPEDEPPLESDEN